MIASDIITAFETYVDDTSELSSVQELALLQKVYNKIWSNRPWEFAKKSLGGTLSTSVPYVALPADFEHLVENNQYTDNTANIDNSAAPIVVFIGSNYTPYQVINWSDRRQYLNRDRFAYVDFVNNRLTFTKQPLVADTYEYDYKAIADTLITSSIPAFPVRFHDMLYHGMAVDNDIILKYPKAASYAQENQAKYDSIFADMASWNARLRLD